MVVWTGQGVAILTLSEYYQVLREIKNGRKIASIDRFAKAVGGQLYLTCERVVEVVEVVTMMMIVVVVVVRSRGR